MRHLALWVLVLATWSTTASAQDGNRLAAHLALGAGGEVTIDPDDTGEADVDLDATVGLGIRYELVLGDLLSIAPMFEWLTYELDGFDVDREHIMNFDVFIKLRGTVYRSGTTNLELYGGIPVGFTVATRSEFGGDDDPLLGFNLGVMGGLAAFFGKFGVFVEIGWRGHQVWRNDVRYGANQAGIHLGGAIAL